MTIGNRSFDPEVGSIALQAPFMKSETGLREWAKKLER
jgi:hypothetical protein